MKQLNEINTIAVIGAGVMGAGIAQICAQAGYDTLIFDKNEAALAKARQGVEINLQGAVDRGKLSAEDREATLGRIQFTPDFSALKADVVIEAIIERLDVKQALFKDLAELNGPETILATNTSSIPITQIAFGTPNPERVVGMHFFNPAHLMKLVEVISGAATDPEVAQVIYDLASKLGKTPVMAKDAPGFIVNRVARHYYVESLKALEENVAPLETIDELMEATGFRMGPFRLMDLIGVETNFSVTSSMFEQFHQDPKFRPSRIQKQKVDAGYHGRKTGRGFYTY